MADEVIHTIDYHVSVDLYDRTVKSSMYCRSNDTANRIYLTLHRGGEIYDVHDDVFAQVLYYRDGEESEHESPIVQIAYPYHGRVIIDVPAGVINEPGEVNVRVKLYSNQFGTAEIASTPIWRIVIPDDAYFDEGIPPAESQSGYDYVVSTWNAANEAAEAANEAAETANVATEDATNAAAEARAAEDATVLAEGQRVLAENQRRLAELGRIAAEAIRQQSYTDKIPTAEKGEANGVAPLDENSLIPAENIPPASANVLGGVKIGSGLFVETDGTLNVQGGSEGTHTVNVSIDSFGHNPTADEEDIKAIAEHGSTQLKLNVSDGIFYIAQMVGKAMNNYSFSLLNGKTLLIYNANTNTGVITIAHEYKFAEEE